MEPECIFTSLQDFQPKLCGVYLTYLVRAAFPYLTHNSSSGTHPAPSPVGTGGDFPGGKWPGREADHSPPSSAEVKNRGAIPRLPHVIMA
jgi:hypothetical protein